MCLQLVTGRDNFTLNEQAYLAKARCIAVTKHGSSVCTQRNALHGEPANLLGKARGNRVFSIRELSFLPWYVPVFLIPKREEWLESLVVSISLIRFWISPVFQQFGFHASAAHSRCSFRVLLCFRLCTHVRRYVLLGVCSTIFCLVCVFGCEFSTTPTIAALFGHFFEGKEASHRGRPSSSTMYFLDTPCNFLPCHSCSGYRYICPLGHLLGLN